MYARCGYETVNIRLEQLGLLCANYLEEGGCDALFLPATYAHHAPLMEAVPGFYAPFSHRHAAVRAGLGEFGLNNLVLHPKYGCRMRWMSIITTAALRADPLVTKPVCLREKCQACLAECGAIVTDSDLPRGIFRNPPLTTDKLRCYKGTKDGDASCWGRCIALCPIGRKLRPAKRRSRAVHD